MPLLGVFLALVLFGGTAPASGLDLERLPSQLSHQVWGKREGLPADAIWALHRSDSGYLWIGTESGVARFDGARFTLFSSQTREEFVSDEVRAIAEGPSDTIWIATVGGGLLRITGNQVVRFDTEDGLSSNGIYSAHVASNGDLWLGTASGVCRRANEQFECFGASDGVADGRIMLIAEDAGGTLWFAGITHGLSSFNGDSFTRHQPPSDSSTFQVLTMIASPDHNILISTYSREFYAANVGGLKRVERAGLPDDFVPISSLRDSDNNVFFGAQNGGGLWQLSPKVQELRAPDKQFNHILALVEGEQGELWVGTSAGLYRIQAGAVVPWGETEGLANSTFVVEPDDLNNLWVGTDGRGLFKISADQSIQRISASTVSPSDTVPSLLMAQDGILWASAFGGGVAWIKNNQIVRVLTISDGLGSNQITALYEDSDGAVWIGTSGGLNRWFKGVITHTFRQAEGMSTNLVRYIEEDKTRRLLLSGDNGLVRLSLDTFSVIDRFGATTGLLNDAVATTYVDSRGVAWIGGRSGGLSRLEGDHLFTFEPEHGLLTSSVMSIVEDEQANLWLGGRQGIARIPISDLDSVARGKSDRVSSRLFTKQDGLRSTRIPGGYQSAGARTPDGRLWFATGQGLASVDPSELQPLGRLSRVTIEEVRADGVTIPGDSQFRIPANTRSVQIDYTQPQLAHADGLRFRYRLDGDDDQWVKAGERRTAFFSSLPPRSHLFQVSARREGETEATAADTVASIELYVEPRWFQSYPALVVFGLFGLALMVLCYRMAVRRYRDQQLRLESLVSERTLALTSALDKVKALSLTDTLTGVANRRHFEERLAKDWQRAGREGRSVGILMIDIDFFKHFNDAAGHQEGDRCLRLVAQTLKESLRQDDFIARYGGEEFTVLLSRLTHPEMHKMGRRLQQAVRSLNIPHPGLPGHARVTVSAGLAVANPTPKQNAEDLLRQADAALYKAKAEGRDRLCLS